MPPVSPFNSILKKAWNYYAEDIGKSLIHLGAFGWFLSAAAQVTMIARNKDIDKKEKEFLIPQEIADGVINVGLYYTICQGIKTGCERLLENGVIMTKKSMETILKMKPTPNSASDYIKSLSEFYKQHRVVTKKKSVGNLTDFYNGTMEILNRPVPSRNNIVYNNEMLKSTFLPIMQRNKCKSARGLINIAFKNYKRYKNGIGVVAAVGASVLACNIITPIARNITANLFQKNAQKRTAKKKQGEIAQLQPYKLPVSNAFNRFKI